jgi:hypothetical protein
MQAHAQNYGVRYRLFSLKGYKDYWGQFSQGYRADLAFCFGWRQKARPRLWPEDGLTYRSPSCDATHWQALPACPRPPGPSDPHAAAGPLNPHCIAGLVQRLGWVCHANNLVMNAVAMATTTATTIFARCSRHQASASFVFVATARWDRTA